MSEKTRKLIEDMKMSLAHAIDTTIDGDFTTGYALCMDQEGNIHIYKDTTFKGESRLNLRCPSPGMEPRASIIITPKKKF